jgi:serine/threonine protein phosphatase PrpC
MMWHKTTDDEAEKMQYIAGYCTETGTVKKINQDSLCVLQAKTEAGQCILAVVCDGMGGLSKGELASATVVRRFTDWFQNELPEMLEDIEEIKQSLSRLIEEQNRKILEYGHREGIQLGTTASALLIVPDGRYIIVHVGDTRVYEIGNEILQLTEDQTFVNREVKRGNMSKEQAARDKKRNVLLQCIGVADGVEPELVAGITKPGNAYLLCSDGFRHELSDKEIFDNIVRMQMKETGAIAKMLSGLVHLNEERGEKDNISAILICIQ